MSSEYAFDISGSLLLGQTFHSLFKPEYDSKRFKPKEGSNVIRILPPSKWVAKTFESYGISILRHYANGSAHNGAYVCLNNEKLKSAFPNSDLGEPCPLCEYHAKLAAKYGYGKIPQGAGCYASVNLIVWVVDRTSTSSEPLLWAMPAKHIAKALSLISKDTETGEILSVCSPTKGYDIHFEVTPKGGSAKYVGYEGVRLAKSASPISPNPATVEKYMSFIEKNSLEKTLLIPTVKELAKVFPTSGLDETAFIEKQESGESHPTKKESIEVNEELVSSDSDLDSWQ